MGRVIASASIISQLWLSVGVVAVAGSAVAAAVVAARVRDVAATTIAGAYAGAVLGAAVGVGALLAADAVGVASPALVELGVAAASTSVIASLSLYVLVGRRSHRGTGTASRPRRRPYDRRSTGAGPGR